MSDFENDTFENGEQSENQNTESQNAEPQNNDAWNNESQNTEPQNDNAWNYESQTTAPYVNYTSVKEEKKGIRLSRRVMVLSIILVVALLALAVGGGFMVGRSISSITWGDGGTIVDPTPSARGALNLTVNTRSVGVPEEGSLPAVAAAAKQAVVEITTTETVMGSYYQNYVQSGAGSGVLIAAEQKGLILTCAHVIEGADEGGITVTLADGRVFAGSSVTVLGEDSWSDLALLQIRNADSSVPTDLTYATLATEAAGQPTYSYMAVGETVVAIGNPLGSLGGSVSRGIISALGRQINVDGVTMTLLQIDASVNPGNSGGGLFNMAGELIGIVNAKATGDNVDGIGFAIPSTDAINIVGQLYSQGYVSGRPFLGLYYNQLNNGYYYVTEYAYASELPAGTEIRSGDIIYSIDGIEVSSETVFRQVLSGKEVGDTVTVVFYRQSRMSYQTFSVDLTIHEYVPTSN